MTIQEALTQLDPANDAHWTTDGLPLVDVVRGLTNNPDVTRKDITEASPGFCRDQEESATEPEPKGRDELLREEQKQLELKMVELTRAKQEVEAELIRAQRRWTQLQAYFDKQDSPQQGVQDRITYIKTQAQIRHQRAERANRLLQGLDPAALSSKAPIDEAMSRKNTRGTQRPMQE